MTHSNERTSGTPEGAPAGMLANDAPRAALRSDAATHLAVAQAAFFLAALGKDPATTRLRTFLGKGAKSDWDLAKAAKWNQNGGGVYFVTGNGGDSDAQITSCPALFVEWDDGASIEVQMYRWQTLKLPEPTVMVWTGGKSVHCYWVLDQPMAPADWRSLQKRLIDYAGGDKACCNPSRLMRLPGFKYEKTPGAGDLCQILGNPSGNRYKASDIAAGLPAEVAPKPAARALEVLPGGLSGDLPPRGLDAINAAAGFIPRRVGGEGTYDSDRNALCGCSAALSEAGHPDPDGAALALLGHLWPDESAAAQVLSSTTTRKASSFWAIAKERGYDTRRHDLKGVYSQALKDHLARPVEAGPPIDPSRSEALKLGFTELLESALVAIRAKDLDTEMEIRAEIMGRFKRSDTQITAALFWMLTEQETGKPAGSTIKAEALDLDSIEGLDALLDGFIPANDLGLMYGAKGSGKTLAALAMGFAAIDGTGFLDHSKPAQQGPVLFIASDSGAPPLMAAMQDLGVADHPAIRGEDRSFYVWAHSASQGMESWCASINGCVQLLQFVKAKGIKLVLIDSAKTICAKAGISYLDNDSIAALLTFIKEAICPHTSVMILSHDGTEKGSHSGAKVWAEVPSVVHNIQQVSDAPQERLWRVVKSRMGPLRELRYRVGEDGGLEVCEGVETIQDGTAAVIQVLTEATAKGVTSMSRAGLVQEIQQRFRLAPKTIDNTLVRMVRAISPDICRVSSKRGHYKLSPRLAAAISLNNVSPNGKEEAKKPVRESDLTTSRGVGSGNSREVKPEFPPSSHFPGVGNSQKTSDLLDFEPLTSREVEMPMGEMLIELFSKGTGVEVLDQNTNQWSNGFTVMADDGGATIKVETPTGRTTNLRRAIVRWCH